LTTAFEAVVNEGMVKKPAAKMFSVSRSTLQYRPTNPDHKVSCGPALVLSISIFYILRLKRMIKHKTVLIITK
jgi:hypothetical protein